MTVPSIIVMGTSWGGLFALETVLQSLPKEFPLPVAIVQHRMRDSEETLAMILKRYTALPVSEAEDKEDICPGHVYLAPSEYHLLVEKDHFALSLDGPVNYARPSADVLFESAAETHGTGVIGVIMTGAGRDGALGLAKIKQRGGMTVVQDAAAECNDMPKAAIAASIVDRILPLEKIGPFLVETCCAKPEKGTGPICRNGPQGASHKLDLSPLQASGTVE